MEIVSVIFSLIVFLATAGLGLATFSAMFPGSIFFPGSLIFGGFFWIISILYFTLSDYMYHQTVGKSIFRLKVATTDASHLDIGKAFVRNISKVYWVLLLLDLIGGFFTHVSPGQKFSDHIANTNVVQS